MFAFRLNTPASENAHHSEARASASAPPVWLVLSLPGARLLTRAPRNECAFSKETGNDVH